MLEETRIFEQDCVGPTAIIISRRAAENDPVTMSYSASPIWCRRISSRRLLCKNSMSPTRKIKGNNCVNHPHTLRAARFALANYNHGFYPSGTARSWHIAHTRRDTSIKDHPAGSVAI